MAIYIQDADGNYVAVPNITGEPGSNAIMRVSDGYIQWKNDDTDWQNMIAVSDLQGTDGESGQEVSLRVTDGTILQWRLGDGSWQTLFDISAYATVSVDETVETLAPGSAAKVVNIGTDPYIAVLKFSIPKGEKGDPGDMSSQVYDTENRATDIFKYIDEHKEDTNNPHGVTAAQVNAVGLLRGTAIPSNSDMNDYTVGQAGVYYVQSASVAATISNLKYTGGSSVVEVRQTAASNSCMQIQYASGDANIPVYIRRYNGSAWGKWVKWNNLTASDVGAYPLYTSLEDIGCTADNTIEEVYKAMPEYSLLILRWVGKSAGSFTNTTFGSSFPTNYGTLYAQKTNPNSSVNEWTYYPYGSGTKYETLKPYKKILTYVNDTWRETEWTRDVSEEIQTGTVVETGAEWTDNNTVIKKIGNVVHLFVEVTKIRDTNATSYIMTLPEGFRPARKITFAYNVINKTSTSDLTLDVDGVLTYVFVSGGIQASVYRGYLSFTTI